MKKKFFTLKCRWHYEGGSTVGRENVWEVVVPGPCWYFIEKEDSDFLALCNTKVLFRGKIQECLEVIREHVESHMLFHHSVSNYLGSFEIITNIMDEDFSVIPAGIFQDMSAAEVLQYFWNQGYYAMLKPKKFVVGDERTFHYYFGAGITTYQVDEISEDRTRILLSECWIDLDGSGTRPAKWHPILIDEDGNESALIWESRTCGKVCIYD